MTAIELIEETANYYNLNNRGFETGIGCQYLTPTGKMCAVGRCIIKKNLPSFQEKYDGEAIYFAIDSNPLGGFDSLLKVKYRNMPEDIWHDLQNFHDNASNWNDTGLSKRGELLKKALIERYS